jgi:hypothetical protein
MAGHLSASWARVQVRVVVLRIFRNRAAAGDLKIKDSALRRQPAQERLNIAVVNSGRRLEFVIRARRRPWAGLAVKREARKKEVRPKVNPAGRLLQPSATLDNQSAETKRQKDQHRRQGHSNFWRNYQSGSGEKNSGAVFLQASFVGRLCQTPIKFAIRNCGVWYKRPTKVTSNAWIVRRQR